MRRILKENWVHIGRPIGFWAFAYHLFVRVLGVAFGDRLRFVIYRVYVQPLVQSDAPLRTGYTLREVLAGSVEETLGQRPREILAQRRALGYRCFALDYKDETVAYAWFATQGEFFEDEFRLRYLMHPAGELVWDFDVFVAEKWRAGRAFQQLWLGCSQQLRAQGFLASASRIHLNNVNSVLSHERLGAQIVTRLALVRIGRFECCAQSSPIGLRAGFKSELSVLVKNRGWPAVSNDKM
jgi:hypothetical protein